MSNVKCPNCGSRNVGLNAFTNLIPLDEQFIYTCGECNEQFNSSTDLDDESLIQKIVSDQVSIIRLREQWKHNPLGQPPLTRDERERQDAEWQEALRRGLGDEINKQIRAEIARPGEQDR